MDFVFGLLIFTIVLFICCLIYDLVKDDAAIVLAIIVSAILWLLTGIGLFLE